MNLRSFVQPEASVKAQIIAKQKCSFVIDGDIVSKIIMDLLLMPFEEGGKDVLDEDEEQEESEAGMTVHTEIDRLKEDSGTKTGSPYHGVLKAVATFSLTIVDVVSKIVAEQGIVEDDAGAGAVVNEIPPVLPVDLCSMAPRAFSAVLQKQKDHLLDKVSEEDIENVDAQFRRLRIAYREDEGMGLQLDANHSTNKVQSFKHSWSPSGKEYDALNELCGGLASVMPGMSSLESDFSLINWTRDPHSKSLSDFS